MKKLFLMLMLMLLSAVAFADCLPNENQIIEYTEGVYKLDLPSNTTVLSIAFSSKKGSGSALVKNLLKPSNSSESTLFNVKWPNNGFVQVDTGRMIIDPVFGKSIISATKRPINVTLIWCERK